jgi:hypothetical protein
VKTARTCLGHADEIDAGHVRISSGHGRSNVLTSGFSVMAGRGPAMPRQWHSEAEAECANDCGINRRTSPWRACQKRAKN